MIFSNLKGLTDRDLMDLEKLYKYHHKDFRKEWVPVFEKFHNTLIDTQVIFPSYHGGTKGSYARAGLTYKTGSGSRDKAVLGFDLNADGISFHFYVGKGYPYRAQHYIRWGNNKNDWCGVIYLDYSTIDEILKCAASSMHLVLGDNAPKLELPSVMEEALNDARAKSVNLSSTDTDGRSNLTNPRMTVLPEGCSEPTRSQCISERIIRDTDLTIKMKSIYNHECQICGHRIALPNGAGYAEAHHIFPLGEGGPDVPENLICVCPNCHVELDYCVKKIIYDDLLLVSGHKINSNYVDSHNDRVKMK